MLLVFWRITAPLSSGTGAPCAAAMLAQNLHSPDLMIMFEAGGVGPILPSMPISVGDSTTFYKALLAGSMPEIMETCQRGMVDYTFLGGAQIDMYGNINSTMVGKDFDRPKVRFPGSGGANDLASFCWRIMVITPRTNAVLPMTSILSLPPAISPGRGPVKRRGCLQGAGRIRLSLTSASSDLKTRASGCRWRAFIPA